MLKDMLAPVLSDFEEHRLDEDCSVFLGQLPTELVLFGENFNELWDLHPAEYIEVMIHGKLVKIPRFQQAYERDYQFSGQIAEAKPAPEILQPYLMWIQSQIDGRLNGLLLNWYDGRLGHYIGDHHDVVKGLVPGSPIVTLSFGEQRIFRMSQGKGGDRKTRDLLVTSGSVIVIPWETNLAWKHAVPKSTRATSRRISITARAFKPTR